MVAGGEAQAGPFLGGFGTEESGGPGSDPKRSELCAAGAVTNTNGSGNPLEGWR